MIRWFFALSALAVPCALAAACGSSKGGGDQGQPPGSGGPDDAGTVGQIDGGVSYLPTLPTLTNVVGTLREDSVGIDFDPVDDAVDYRVYALPAQGDVTVNGDGSLTIKNAVYRCAGLRQTFDVPNNVGNDLQNPDAGQVYENPNHQFSWTVEVPDNDTLGYVWVEPGDGRVPVYAIGVHPSAPEVGWRESRPKIYTTDASLHATLTANGGRDDGIVFYVPASAGPTTQTVYHSETSGSIGQNFIQYVEYYFGQADVAQHQGDNVPAAPAFEVLKAQEDGTKPLMAVFYQPGENHTELAVGKERFHRAAYQGPGAMWHLEWSGVTQETTLVIEALKNGCPFQGFLSPTAITAPPHQQLFTMDQLQQQAQSGELYVNGQFDLPGTTYTIFTGNGATGGQWGTSSDDAPNLVTPSSSPIPVARSFIKVAPKPHDPAAWDWYQGFNVGSDFGPSTATTDTANCACQQPGATAVCQNGNGGCGYWMTPNFAVGANNLDVSPNDVGIFGYGTFLGQLWDVLDDAAQDVTSAARFTALQTANIASDPGSYVHVTWSVNTVSTDRRYPQLVISDQQPPIPTAFLNPNGNTLLIQTRQGPSPRFEVQAFHGLVNGKPWAVNNQAPVHYLIDYDTWNTQGGNPTAPTGQIQPIPPADSPFEHAGNDRMTKYDAYVSNARVYVFQDGAPAGCVQLAGTGVTLNGPVTLSFGDVLYHESAPDELVCFGFHPYTYMHEHECAETKRHWDDLGFKNAVPPPQWDEKNYPCAPF